MLGFAHARLAAHELTVCSLARRSQLGQSRYAWQLIVKKHYCHSETKHGEQVNIPHICWCMFTVHTGGLTSDAHCLSINLLTAGLPTAVVLDDELDKPARTVLAIGPGASIDIDSITSQLRLYDQVAETE